MSDVWSYCPHCGRWVQWATKAESWHHRAPPRCPACATVISSGADQRADGEQSPRRSAS